MSMSPQAFVRSSQALVGTKIGWMSRTAEKLDISVATVSRYASGKLIVPHSIKLALMGLRAEKIRARLL